eukprot:6998781-Pyramimonas_sp.AAC.1
MGDEFPIPLGLRRRWRLAREVSLAMPPSRVWPVLKTYDGGWPTSFRMHVAPEQEPRRLNCIDGGDSIVHFVWRRALWHLLALPRGKLRADPLVRVGLGAAHQHQGDQTRLDSPTRVV